jgi:hypothetical protein
MTVVLRSQKTTALTFEEMDGNFTDINSRTTALESNYIKTLNGQTATNSSLTLTTDNIAEAASATNIWYTDARARASISITDAGGDGSLSYNSTTGVLTYTGPSASEVRAHISATSATGVTYTAGTGIISLASIPNSSITNSTITFAGDATTDAVSLGETITFTGGEGIDTSVTANVLTINAEVATASNLGVASFSSDHFSIGSGAVTLVANGVDDTLIDFGTGTNQVSTADLPEQTNLYYTDARVLTKINATSVDALSDVDTSSVAPSNNQVLTWSSSDSEWIPATPPGAAGGESNTISSVGSGSSVFKQKTGTEFELKSIIGGTNISAVGNTNDVTLNLDATPSVTGLTIANGGNIGSVGDTDAIAIASDGVVTMDQIPVFSAGINVSGGTIAGTLATAAQTSITSIGILAANLQLASTKDIVLKGASFDTTVSATAPTSARSIVIPDVSGTVITTGNLSGITEVGTISGTINVGSLASLDGGINVNDDFTVNTDGNVVTSGTLIVTNSITANSLVVDGITINDNNITTNSSNANLVLITSGTGVVEVDSQIDMNSNKIVNLTDPTSNQEAATKAYVDTAVSSLSSSSITVLDTNVAITDTGTNGQVLTTIDGVARITTAAAQTTFTHPVAMSSNKITGIADPGAAQDAATKAYVDSEVSAISTTSIAQNNTNITVTDGGTGSIVATVDATAVATIAAAGITLNSGAFVGALTGDVTTDGINITDNNISTTRSNDDINMIPNGTGKVQVVGNISAATFIGAFTGDVTGTADAATTVTLADESTDATCFPTFSTAATGDQALKTDSVLTYNSSNGTLGATTFSGVATSAQYADLAEMYVPDAEYPAGTVVSIGGGAEITFCNQVNTVAGVISTNPAYLMNSALENGAPVALVGRVPVRVVGSVLKGQMVYADLNGVASATATGGKVGIALETNEETGEKLIECMLKA